MNLKFIEALVTFLLDSVKPLTEGEVVDAKEEEEKEEEIKDTVSHHHLSSVSRTQSVVEERESTMIISAKIVHPLVALLEDASQINSHALVCQVRPHAHTQTSHITQRVDT